MKTSAEIAELLQEAMSSSPGISEMTVDGIKIVISQTALDYWLRRAAREASTRPLVASIDLN